MTLTDPAVKEALASLQNTFARMDGKLRRIPIVGRVPSQDVFANEPGYTPGLSKEAGHGQS